MSLTSSLVVLALTFSSVSAFAQVPVRPPKANNFYVVSPQDVLAITSSDQPDLTGKFAVGIDGTLTCPLIGRVEVGGKTLREVEAQLKTQLVEGGFSKNPKITVAKLFWYLYGSAFVTGEVREPGSDPPSGEMKLADAPPLAGSTLPTVSRDAKSVYVSGHIKNPGTYALQHSDTMVLQVLSLAGGLTDRGTMGRIRVIRIVNGDKREFAVKLTDVVQPNDTIVVPEKLF